MTRILGVSAQLLTIRGTATCPQPHHRHITSSDRNTTPHWAISNSLYMDLESRRREREKLQHLGLWSPGQPRCALLAGREGSEEARGSPRKREEKGEGMKD